MWRLGLCTRKKPKSLRRWTSSTLGKTTCLRVDPVREKNKLVVQLGAAEGECASRAAAVVADVACGVDLNMGCPKPLDGRRHEPALLRRRARGVRRQV